MRDAATNGGVDALIGVDATTVRLEGVAIAAVDAEDFIFA